jgi:acetate kinase
MEMNVLVLNSGSSTLKFQLISADLNGTRKKKGERLCRGQIEGIGGEAMFEYTSTNCSKVARKQNDERRAPNRLFGAPR